MNKTQLIDVVATKTDLTKKGAEAAVNATIASVVEALKAGDKVQLVGFGTFEVKEQGERQGINPLTKQPITIAAKKVVKFKAGSELSANL